MTELVLVLYPIIVTLYFEPAFATELIELCYTISVGDEL